MNGHPTRSHVQSAVVQIAVNKYSLSTATPAVKEVMELIDRYVDELLNEKIRREIEVI